MMNCPFCGKAAASVRTEDVGHGNSDVRCKPCGHTTRMMTETINKMLARSEECVVISEEE